MSSNAVNANVLTSSRISNSIASGLNGGNVSPAFTNTCQTSTLIAPEAYTLLMYLPMKYALNIQAYTTGMCAYKPKKNTSVTASMPIVTQGLKFILDANTASPSNGVTFAGSPISLLTANTAISIPADLIVSVKFISQISPALVNIFAIVVGHYLYYTMHQDAA